MTEPKIDVTYEVKVRKVDERVTTGVEDSPHLPGTGQRVTEVLQAAETGDQLERLVVERQRLGLPDSQIRLGQQALRLLHSQIGDVYPGDLEPSRCGVGQEQPLAASHV